MSIDKGSRVAFSHLPHGELCVAREEEGTVLADNGDGTLLIAMDATPPATLRKVVLVDAADCELLEGAAEAADKRAAEELAAAEKLAADAAEAAAKARAKADAVKARAPKATA